MGANTTTRKHLDLVDWNDLPDYLFIGCRAGVPEKLREYLITLKDSGAGRVACAINVGLSYQTVISQRAREPDFERFEGLAEQVNIAMVDSALFTSATNPENRHQVPAASLWKKSRYNWSEPKTIVEQLNSIDIDFSTWSEPDQKVAMRFAKLVEKYAKQSDE